MAWYGLVWIGMDWILIIRKESISCLKRIWREVSAAPYAKPGISFINPRQKTPVANNLCGYMIVDSKYNACVGGPNYELDLDDVAAFCKEYCD